jgi:molybdate/tungstate transport system substrate-binding protein
MARMISELGKPADIMAAADYLVIDENLIPDKASWTVRFATNRLVLCYTERSRYADQINSGNWFEILARDDVAWGHSDPNLDPCGYRSLMVMQLAEKYYKRPGLYQRLIDGRPIRNVRPKSVELIAMLRTGHLDYAWEYLSVAVQHGLKYLELPDEINLGNPDHDDFYAQARVKVTGKRPGTWIERRGRSCVYGITMIDDAKNRKAALAFLDYLLDPEGGLKILAANGQPPIVPCRVSSREMLQRLPKTLQKWVVADR